MAKGKRKKRKPGPAHPAKAMDVETILAEVESILPSLDSPDAGSHWGEVQRKLAKAKADTAAVGRAVMARDTEPVKYITN